MSKYVLIVVIIIITAITVDCRNYNTKNYMRNLNKNIMNYCNKKALSKTNNTESYNCIISSNDCSNIENFTEFKNIRNECIKQQRNEFTIGVICGFMMIIIVGLFI